MNARTTRRRKGNLAVIPTVNAELAGHMSSIEDNEVECRAGHHAFELDTWHISDPLPASVYARPGKDGCFELVSPCDNCGAKLIITTGPGGGLDGALPRRIDYAGTWYHLPSHLPRGKRAFRREKFSRGNAKIQARIRAAALVDDEATPVSSVPSVKFRS
jgi:hypothetical protein